ncbi:MAG: cobyrinate a,c-diamide synthase [Gammaproteobacteria bacterium]|nr:cobyrinate a,c-diamide synthase [Gammaproteobacteria bacterium]
MSVAPQFCRALFIGAPASGQGKTTVTAALARHYRRQGLRVRVFKTGPDFLDPMILEQASGAPVYQLDLWMGSESHCRALLRSAAAEADVILVEGVMGLFDGEPSGADLAALFGLPVLAVIDASAMAQTFGALAHGLAHYRENLLFAGVLANRVASPGHTDMLRSSLPADLRWFGALPRDAQLALPSRHLGLHQAAEIADLDARIEAAADALAAGAHLDLLPPLVDFGTGNEDSVDALDDSSVSTPLRGCRIAVAFDAAFSFLYRANLDLLRQLGADIRFFSPLKDAAVPEADALYLPGGYPELHLRTLTENESLKQSIRFHHARNKPIVAECGGMMLLLETLETHTGERGAMVGLLPGGAIMQSQLVNLGMHSVTLPEGTLRGHTFHHSLTQTTCLPLTHTEGRRGKPEAVYRIGRLHASYLHCYFPSNPQACARLFAA